MHGESLPHRPALTIMFWDREKFFASTHLAPAPESRPPAFFIPSENGRDKFGNRLFTSQNLAYLDAEEGTITASLLISAEGEVFLRKNNGILNDIQIGLTKIQRGKEILNFDRRRIAKRDLRLKSGRVFRFLGEGNANYVFSLETNDIPQVAIRISQWDLDDPVFTTDIPMTLKMLEIQDLKEKFEQKLLRHQMRIVTPLFASSHMLATEFVEKGNGHVRPNFDLIDKMYQYVERKRAKQDPLWRRGGLGMLVEIGGFSKLAPGNFIDGKDSLLVCVDPVLN